jgi:hypothetical protein
VRGASLAGMILGSTAGALVVGAPTRADAEAPAEPSSPCARVDTSADLPAAWGEAMEQLRVQIARLPASECQPMVLTLAMTPDGNGARIVATTADGRHAERGVGRPDSLVAIGLGLLMSTPPPATTTSSATAPPTAVPAAAPTAVPSAAPTPTTVPPRPVGVWLGIDVGGRATASMAMLDLNAFGALLLDHWMVALSLGGSPTAVTGAQGLDDDAYREVNAALGVGRRIDLGGAALDVAGSVAIVAMQMEYDYPDGRETSGNDVELGLGTLARLDLPLSQAWALTVSVDGRVLPGNAFSATTLEVPPGETNGAALPSFPVWSAALRVGAMAELLR